MDSRMDAILATALFQCYLVAKENGEHKTAEYTLGYIRECGFDVVVEDGKVMMTKKKED